MAKQTPMMKQYLKIKEEYSDCILFFRMGDFYEMFFEDAEIGARVLDITLTSRDKDRKIPMAGVPYHAVDSYLSKMVKAGYKVAICEQVSEPDGKGLVKREVVRVVTPGTVLDEKTLERGENNYLMSVTLGPKNTLGLALCDLSTGEFLATQIVSKDLKQELANELTRFSPVECILPEGLYNDPEFLGVLRSQRGLNIYCFYDWAVFADDASRLLKQHFQVTTLEGFGIHDKYEALKACAALLGYLKQTQRSGLSHLQAIKTYTREDCLILDRSTILNLELFATSREAKSEGSLIKVLDKTTTAMGGRLLRKWLLHPLVELSEIEKRQEAISDLLAFPELRERLLTSLASVTDIERLISRLASGLGNARDLVSLKLSLREVLRVKETLIEVQTSGTVSSRMLAALAELLDPRLGEVVSLVENQIVDEPPFDVHSGGLLREGVVEELDQLRERLLRAKTWLSNYEAQERERTGIASLKVRFNRVFGYYLEVSKPNLHLVPSDYERKQTLVNAERFTTPSLKEHEELVLTASERMNQIEYEVFLKLVGEVLSQVGLLQRASQAVAELDCLLSLALLAERNQYVRPTMVEGGELIIEEGRHPVVEHLLPQGEFVPNNVRLDLEDNQVLILTGPNMAGKSVLMRQVALIALMAQIGSFVPAKKATLSVIDRLFVRSGARDVITSNLSTFMVEMVETANILLHASPRSLVILDEVGRGTSTYDGLSLAWAVVEYLASHPKNRPKTLFATHYHELQELAQRYENVKNYQMLVEENKGELRFLYRMVPGGASHSYGIAVAALAGVPREVIRRAVSVLKKLERKGVETPSEAIQIPDLEQMSLIVEESSPILEDLRRLEVDNLTPLEALQKLVEYKKQLGEQEGS